MNRIEIRNGRLIDPLNNIDRPASLFIAEGRIASIGSAPEGFAAERIIDASGAVVCPGFIDLGARLNSIEAELAAAVAGGVTSVVVPPDTDPPLDEPELADRLVHRAADIGRARVLPLGALTLGLKGERLAELGGLARPVHRLAEPEGLRLVVVVVRGERQRVGEHLPPSLSANRVGHRCRVRVTVGRQQGGWESAA